ncbi:hypothetical protein [Oligoflexus tunisiensis]|uniref:hypothetical protein n=1 Tax=Oligoflexus tunisiensis TaxID=708132 RepID=UPI00114D1BEB|nr:hypothetical protein [Oligoflexus tunisiensis]
MKRLIKARRYRSLLLISTSLLSACGGSPQQSRGVETPPDISQVEPIEIAPVFNHRAHLTRAFEDLAQTCRTVGGIFDERERNCLCPDTTAGNAQSFQALYRTDPNATGLKRRVFDRYACVEEYRLRPAQVGSRFADLLAGGREAFIADLRKVRNIGNGRSLVFEIDDSLPDAQLRDLAAYLDERAPSIHIPPGNQWREMFRVKLFKADESLDRVKRLPYFDFEDTGLIERYGNEIFVWSLDDFEHLDATPPPSELELPQMPLVRDPMMPKLMEGLKAYQDYLKGAQPLDVREDVLIVDSGCHILCDYKASFYWDGQYYWYEKNYARGSAFRHAFYLGREDGTLDAMTLLFPDLTPSVYITEQRSVGPDGRLQVDSNAHDSQGDLLRFTEYPPLGDGKSFASKWEQLKTFRPEQPDTTVLVLEESTQLEETWELDYWIRGPFAAERPTNQKSLYGWIRPDDVDGNPFSFYFGAMDLNWSTDAAHGREILRDLMRDIKPGEAYGISTDFTWLLQGQRFNELVKLSKARIATISAILSVEEEECHRLTAALDADILWIAGAGNEGKENPRFRCPQKLDRKDLRIVAAAGARQGLAFFSEFGRDYADIAADPISYLGRRGSSYSAPKVANVALKIIKKHGEALSNREVRLAILLGADVDPQHRLEVRTGGALHEGYALKAAAAIAGLPAGSRRLLQDKAADRTDVFSQIIAASGALSEDQAQDQARFLVRHGL